MLAKMTVGTTDLPKNNTLDLLVDTGSSWSWVMSCNKHENDYWENNTCPYFDMTTSSSLSPMEKEKQIVYGGNTTVRGSVYDEYLQVYGSSEMKAHFPIILKKMPKKSVALFNGILGLSPNDESAGPLMI